MALNNNGCIVKTVNEVWQKVGSCQLPIVALLSEWGLKMEMEEEEKKKHAGSFSPLSCHLGFVEGFHPAISLPLRSNQYGTER